MRYRSTRGDDHLVGTAADDIFRVRRGHDRVDGGHGIDRLTVDYRGQTASHYDYGRITLDTGGSLSGELLGDERTSVSFKSIEQLTFRASDARDLLSVTVLGIGAPATFTVDAGGGDGDSLDLSFAGETEENVTITDNRLGTAIGTFTGFERFALFLGYGRDIATGGARADYFYGGGEADHLDGRGGDDFLYGGPGADTLFGGAGADVFHYLSIRDSRPRAPDIIKDFSHAEGDLIDVSRIDANPDFERDQPFAFIGERAFTGAGGNGGEIRQQVRGDGVVTVEADVNHDGVSDFTLFVYTDAPLVAADFRL